MTDLFYSKQIGVDYIIAPMIETPYALSKYIDAKNEAYSESERKQIKFLFNLETITSFNNINSILDTTLKGFK